MQRTIFLLFFSLFSIGLFSQNQVAQINDPDGFTNMRKGKSSKTAVIKKIELGDFFYAEPSETESWWKVMTPFGEKGYMHKSRIQLIDSLPPAEKKELIMVSLEIRRMNANAANNAFMDGDKELEKRRRENESHQVASDYNLILLMMTDHYCENPDPAIIENFLKTLLATTNSANESPTYALARMYICDSQRVFNQIKIYEGDERKSLIGSLDWGFQNVTYEKEESIENFEELKAKIEELKGN